MPGLRVDTRHARQPGVKDNRLTRLIFIVHCKLLSMMFNWCLFFIFNLATCITFIHALNEKDYYGKLVYGLNQTQAIISSLESRWEAFKYPSFFGVASMPPHSYETMQLKFEKLILESLLIPPGAAKLNFTMSFMGSSVTAGHDSPFNDSFPVHTGIIMKPAFAAFGINVIAKNVAMGNNPCIPYDICPGAFAGRDADLIHWEQSFNCFPTDTGERTSMIFEQFTRQSSQLPHRPIVVFTTSDTPNWHKQDCEGEKAIKNRVLVFNETNGPILLPIEKKALASIEKDPSALDLFSNINQPVFNNFGVLKLTIKSYRGAAIQLFHHIGYQRFKCHGPYIPEWGCCSASWHPSLLGHSLRASHYSYVWLKIFHTAIQSIINNLERVMHTPTTPHKNYLRDVAHGLGFVSPTTGPLEKLLEHILIQKHHSEVHSPLTPIYPTRYSDNMQCFTDFEPHADEGAGLFKRIVRDISVKIQTADDSSATATAETHLPPPLTGWRRNIMESVFEPNAHIVEHAHKKGYLDFKWMMYGNVEAGNLHISINVKKKGYIFLCQPPGSCGKIPDAFGIPIKCLCSLLSHPRTIRLPSPFRRK